ncbi:hypothetical protein C8R47DRAFT_1325992 [Mycena vitilis]|nr:hypothetical protein C8R47DRAFT_1325992 [Mycena vitilis]
MPHLLDLPPELIAHILSWLRGSKSDLLKCSLVCRDWLPLARNNLDIVVYPLNSSQFLELVASPMNTLVTPIRNLHIASFPTLVRPVFLMLGQFVSLRSLALRDAAPESTDLPVLPLVEELHLYSTTFPSYASFVGLVTKFPALLRLKVMRVTWTEPPVHGEYTFPPLDLHALEIDWNPDMPAGALQAFMAAVLTHSLKLISSDNPSTAFVSALSEYLRTLGTHLTSLDLEYAARNLGAFVPIDFSHSTGLKHLSFGAGVGLMVPQGEPPFVTVCPAITLILSSIATHASLHTLILNVFADSYGDWTWKPLHHFAALLQTLPFASPRTVQFLVSCSPWSFAGSVLRARAVLAPLLRAAMPGREIIILAREA